MGHCSEFVCVVTTANLFMHFMTAQNETVQEKCVTISTLGAIAQDLDMCYGP
jgi:hypothetical protein